MKSTIYKDTRSAKIMLLMYPVLLLMIYLIFHLRGKESWDSMIFFSIYALIYILMYLKKYKITPDGFLKGYVGYGLIRIFTIPMAQISELKYEKNIGLTVKYQKPEFKYPSFGSVYLQKESRNQFVEEITRIRPEIVVTGQTVAL